MSVEQKRHSDKRNTLEEQDSYEGSAEKGIQMIIIQQRKQDCYLLR